MSKNPYTNLGFDSIGKFEFIIMSLVLILGWLTLLQDRTITGFPAVGVDMQNHPWPAFYSNNLSIYLQAWDHWCNRSISWFRIVVFCQKKQITPASSCALYWYLIDHGFTCCLPAHQTDTSSLVQNFYLDFHSHVMISPATPSGGHDDAQEDSREGLSEQHLL